MRNFEVRISFLLSFLASATASKSVGILYEVWHTTAAVAMQSVAQQGGQLLTVETVLQSNGVHTLNDVYLPYGLNADIWNVEPAELGFYCLYRHRDGDDNPPVPDCPNTTAVAQRHAELLVDAGFDYVAIDVTNWPQYNSATDLAVVRPLEVLFEEWAALRDAGIQTPYISVWPAAPVAEYDDGYNTTWQYLLDNFYNNPDRSPLIWKRPLGGGKYTYFVTDNSFNNDTVNSMIASNGGRNNVEVLKMWALFGEANYDAGSWGFFSPCRTAEDSSSYTTSMVGGDEAETYLNQCNQYITLNTTTSQPEVVSASASYMLSQSALPFASPGKLRGLTMQRLFQQVLTTKAPELFMSSFNEHIGGRQAPVSGGAMAFNMGLPDDPQKDSVWVDTYTTEYSRDIEPTIEGGDLSLQLAKSCISLYKEGLTCADVAVFESNSRSNTAEFDLCCNQTISHIWTNVWSLAQSSGGYLLTKDYSEKLTLTSNNDWNEVCVPVSGPSVFCSDVTIDGRNGPFILFNTTQAFEMRVQNSATSSSRHIENVSNTASKSGNEELLINSVSIYRCLNTSSTFHFISNDENCGGYSNEGLLGFASSNRYGEMPRALRTCRDANTQEWYHALDVPCFDGLITEPPEPIGYVR